MGLQLVEIFAAWPGMFAPGLAASETEYRITNIFDPVSRPAEMILPSAYLVSIICLILFVIVGGLLTYTLIRFRRKGPEDDQEEPAQIYGSAQIEMAWVVIPCLIVLVLALVTARTIGDIQNAQMPEDVLEIRLIGHQWWWEIEYPQYGFTAANEIHVPVSARDNPRPTRVILESADVVHSFWVPHLAGKTDLIPGRINQTWIEPFRTGVYFGNCAEYCGTQHANMMLRVYVHEEEDFQAWVANQQAAAVEDPAVVKGKESFMSLSCVSCHSIDGTPARGTFGPDLTHLASRDTLGAGVRMLNAQNLHDWLRNPQAVKRGAHMPDMQLTDDEIKAISDYLLSLK